MQTNVNWGGFGWVSALAWWLDVSVSTLLIGLALFWLIGRGAARLEDTGRTRIGGRLPARVGHPAGPALVPIVGGLIWFVAVVFGLGALVVTIWQARSIGRAAPAPA